MTYEQIVSVLGYANDHDMAVRILTTTAMEVTGIPTSVDTDIAAHEVYLRPVVEDETEIALTLGAIQSVELV